jgi:hypothetical protein
MHEMDSAAYLAKTISYASKMVMKWLPFKWCSLQYLKREIFIPFQSRFKKSVKNGYMTLNQKAKLIQQSLLSGFRPNGPKGTRPN